MLIVKGKGFVKKFNGKCFICNKINHLVKDCENKAQQVNLKNGWWSRHLPKYDKIIIEWFVTLLNKNMP